MDINKVGFIGLGIMGSPMALNLLKGGYALRVYSRRASAMEPLIEAGCVACHSPAAVAQQADVIFIMVPDTKDVREVILGTEGVMAGARPGSAVVDMSTISPLATRALADELGAHGVEMLDAPVSGGQIGAVNGTLSIMVGGKEEVFRAVKPLLECMGKNIVYIGKNGAGQVAKACNQLLIALTSEAVAEALILARQSGVDFTRVREALLGGAAQSKVLELHGKRMLESDFQPGFKARLFRKDLRIIMEMAAELDLALPGASLVTQHVNALVGAGDGDLDSSALVRVVERLNRGVAGGTSN